MSGITLVGAGALGQAFATLLAPGGDTTLFARPATAERLRAEGTLRVQVRGEVVSTAVGDRPGAVRVIDDASAIDPDDAVVFVTKGHTLPEAIATVAAGWRPREGHVLGLQNGVMKDRVLGEAFGPQSVVGAATVLGARRLEDGTVAVTGLGQTYLGEFDGSASARVAELATRWRRADLPVRDDLDIARLLWTKCVNALGAFGIGCLGRLPSNVLMQSEQYAGLFVDLLHEGAAVAQAEGSPVDDFPDLPIATYLATPREELVASLTARVRDAWASPGALPAFSSMAQDVIAGRPTEVDAVFGDVVRRARTHGIAVPRLAVVLDVVGGIDALLPVAEEARSRG